MKTIYKQGGLFDNPRPGMAPLSASRQELAIKWQGYAYKLARQYCSSYGGDQEEWNSVALEALVIAASKFDELRPSLVMGAGNFMSALWHRVRAHLNDYRRRLHMCGITAVSRTVTLERKELPQSVVDHRRDAGGRAGMQEAFESLDERECDVVHGLYSRDETLEKIGGRYGVSRERVRQIKDKALGKMRRVLERREYAGCN